MANEYYAIILEFTPKCVKAGFAGESEPHVSIVPSSFLWKRYVCSTESATRYPSVLGLDSHALLASHKEQMVASLSEEEKTAISQFNKGFGPDWFRWESDNYQTLAKLVKHLILSLLLVSNASAKVFVVDGGLAAVQKFKLCEAFFARKVARAVAFLPRAPCVMLGAGIENGLLVDLGWEECAIVSVFDLRTVAFKHLDRFAEENVHYLSKGECDRLDELIETVFGAGGLAKEISAVIKALDIDCRSLVAEHIVICGLLASIPGFSEKLLAQTRLCTGLVSVNVKLSLGAWAGASLYCSVALLKGEKSGWRVKEITKEKLADSWQELQFLNS